MLKWITDVLCLAAVFVIWDRGHPLLALVALAVGAVVSAALEAAAEQETPK